MVDAMAEYWVYMRAVPSADSLVDETVVPSELLSAASKAEMLVVVRVDLLAALWE